MLSRGDNGFKEAYGAVKKQYVLLQLARKNHYKAWIKNSENKTTCVWMIVNEVKGKDHGSKGVQVP